MNRSNVTALILSLAFLRPASAAHSTVDETNSFSWIANAGWVDWQGDAENGVRFNRRYASGFAYSANTGWIHLGDGTPENGMRYANDSATDYGVNVDADSDSGYYLLGGLAYAANAGWIQFDVTTQAGTENRPRIDKETGNVLGFAWSANLGWLPLDSSPVVVLETEVIPPLLGDANQDDNVTPGDAQVAFECFLNIDCEPGSDSEAADVSPDEGDGCVDFNDGDEAVTPGDAQRIFEVFLGVQGRCF